MNTCISDYSIVASAPDRNSFLSTPSVLSLAGALLAAYDVNIVESGFSRFAYAFILKSVDKGQSWREVFRTPIQHGRLFLARHTIYYIGHNSDIRITRSSDDGETWTSPVDLTQHQKWHQTAANVHIHKDNIYLVTLLSGF